MSRGVGLTKMNAGELFIFIIFLGLIFHSIYRVKKARVILRKYFERYEIELTRTEYKWFAPLPFLLSSTNVQIWFYTHLRNKHGDAAEAYVKVGHWIAGLLEPIVQVFEITKDGKIVNRTKRKSIIDTIFPERLD